MPRSQCHVCLNQKSAIPAGLNSVLILFFSVRLGRNTCFTKGCEHVKSLLLRLVESQETRRQLCGGKLLLRIWLAPDEAAEIFKFCIRLEVLCFGMHRRKISYDAVRMHHSVPPMGHPLAHCLVLVKTLYKLQIIASSAANIMILLSCFLMQVASLNEPDPLFSLVPRVAYLPFLFSDVLEHFKKSISRMGQPYELWFDYNNIVSWQPWPDLKGNPGMWFQRFRAGHS